MKKKVEIIKFPIKLNKVKTVVELGETESLLNIQNSREVLK